MDTIKTQNQTDSLLASLGGLDQEITLPIAAPLTSTAPLTSPISTGSSTGQSGITSATEEKALHLLGAGVPAESVASALGVTPSRIAQLLSEQHFADKVAELRYQNLQKHNVRDEQYGTLEDKLLHKLNNSLHMLIKPESILKAISIVNGAKRRGQSAPQQVTNQQNIVNLIMPKVITEKFSINVNNQVTKAGKQELLTMASGDLLNRVAQAQEAKVIEHTQAEEIQATEEDI